MAKHRKASKTSKKSRGALAKGFKYGKDRKGGR
jgi:hypothetical protein